MLSEKYLDGFRRWRQLPNVPSSVLTNPNVMDGVTLLQQKGRHGDALAPDDDGDDHIDEDYDDDNADITNIVLIPFPAKQ